MGGDVEKIFYLYDASQTKKNPSLLGRIFLDGTLDTSTGGGGPEPSKIGPCMIQDDMGYRLMENRTLSVVRNKTQNE